MIWFDQQDTVFLNPVDQNKDTKKVEKFSAMQRQTV